MAGQVRQPIDVASLEKYLNERVAELKTPVELKQFGFGQSNPTYLLTLADGLKTVLRKKPPGKLLSKTAHQVEREYRIIHALKDTDVAVPRTYCMCYDESIIGTPFYIMSFLDGRMFEDAFIPGVSASDRHEMFHDAVRTLAKLHRVKPESVGLESFGKPTGFYDRQIKTFRRLADSQAAATDVDTQQAVGQIPRLDDMLAFFRDPAKQPRDRGVPIHGDFKIDNLVFHSTEPRVIGILDWEIATIGHPLSDLCNLTSPWTVSSATPDWPRIHADPAFVPGSDKYPGIPTREQCIEWYSEVAGWRVPRRELAWATSFALFRDAIIFQGIAARHATRQASSEKATVYGREMRPFADMAWTLLEKAKAQQGSGAKL